MKINGARHHGELECYGGRGKGTLVEDQHALSILLRPNTEASLKDLLVLGSVPEGWGSEGALSREERVHRYHFSSLLLAQLARSLCGPALKLSTYLVGSALVFPCRHAPYNMLNPVVVGYYQQSQHITGRKARYQTLRHSNEICHC